MFSGGGGRRLDIKCVHLWNRRRPPAADSPNNNNNSSSEKRRSRVTVGDDVSVGLRWNSQCIYINSTLSLPFTRHPLQLGGDSGSFLVFVPIEKCFVISHSCPPGWYFSLSRWFFPFCFFVVHLLLRVIWFFWILCMASLETGRIRNKK